MERHMKLNFLVAALLLAASVPAIATDMPAVPKFSPDGVHNGTSYDRFIVLYRENSTEARNPSNLVQTLTAAAERAKLLNGATRTHTAPLSIRHTRKLGIGADVVITSRKLSASEARLWMQQIATDPAVEFVQPDYNVQADDAEQSWMSNLGIKSNFSPAFVPDDPLFSDYQWDFLPADGVAFYDPSFGGIPNWGGANIAAAWDAADNGGAGTTIAILDSGITQHPDMNTSLAQDGSYDFISEAIHSGRPNDGRVAGGWDTGDWCVASGTNSTWHGTHVASTAAGLTNNGTGTAGTAYGADVVYARVLGHCGGDLSDVVDAITWTSGGHVPGVPDNQHPATVINLSLTARARCIPDAPAMLLAIWQAVARRGVTVVAGAGNSNADASGFTPASCPDVIAVAATDITSRRAYYSNYGDNVTLAAPGGDGDGSISGMITAAINSGTTTPQAPTYGRKAGTSNAAPHVAGTVALMQGARLAAGKELLTPFEVTLILEATATRPHIEPDHRIGAGILNAAAAVQMAKNEP
jgi:serine protease